MNVIPTRRHLQYATGFIELGMFPDAERELRAIAVNDQASAEVLTRWIDLHMHAKQWKEVITVSQKMVRIKSDDDKGWISWAFALRELNRFEEARDVLLKATPLHGKTCDAPLQPRVLRVPAREPGGSETPFQNCGPQG